MFVDEVEIEVEAGSGGNGSATFRKEKHVAHGGPNGGDGGRGGSVRLVVDPNLTTLLDFRYKHLYRAERGGDGASKDMFGKNGGDLVLKAPLGTVVTNLDTGEIVADLGTPESTAVLARGGIGGRGNTHFVTSVHQAPKFAENGEPGEHRRLKLELKLLADVGLLGYPNVGKSTLIAAVSAARPKIADYPFTTLIPNLGVVYVEAERSFVMADIPGLIEGAHQGQGLGHQFLRHVERTRLLIHLLDVSGMTGRDPIRDFDVLNRELALYTDRLSALPQIVALNKIDVADPESVAAIEATLAERGCDVHLISAATHSGVKSLIFDAMTRLEQTRAEERRLAALAPATEIVVAARREDERRWEAKEIEPHLFQVTGPGIERLVAMTRLENDDGLRRLQRTFDKIGVTARLKALGAADGDTVRIRDVEFEFLDEDRWDSETPGEDRTRRGQAKH
jgi:GTP-binding protein